MGLRLDNYRVCSTAEAFTDADKAQLERFRYDLFDVDENELTGAEVFDVIDDATGELAYQLWLWVGGAGVLFRAGTSEIVVDIVDEVYQAVEPDRALREGLAAAWQAVSKKQKQPIDFREDPREKNPVSAHIPTDVAARIATWRRETAAGRPPVVDKEFWNVIYDALGASSRKRNDPFVFRPFPVLRLFELTPVAREALELIVDLGEDNYDLPRLGLPSSMVLPNDPGNLARFLGRAPGGPLDETVLVAHEPHPRSDAREALVALACIHAHAEQTGGVLDASYDALLENIMNATHYPLPIALSLLDELPPERASKAAGIQIAAIARYPSKDGAARALEWLEIDKLGAPRSYEKMLESIFSGDEAQALLRAAITNNTSSNLQLLKKLLRKKKPKKR